MACYRKMKMASFHREETAGSVVRFVFDDAVLSFDLAAYATFGEIARKMGEIQNRHFGKPISIDVKLGAGDSRPVL